MIELATLRRTHLATFAHHFGIRPWEWDQLTLADVFRLIEELPEG